VSTATAEPEVVGAIVQQPEASVLFLARRSNLRLVHTGRYPLINPASGQRLGMTDGVTVAFVDSEFRCPLSGKVKIMDPGGAGESTIEADALLEFLTTHPRFGDPNEGFIRVDPKAPPLGQAESRAIVAAAVDGDTELLEEIIAQEREGWNREEIIDLAQGSIDRINATLERLRAEADAKATDVEAKAKGK